MTHVMEVQPGYDAPDKNELDLADLVTRARNNDGVALEALCAELLSEAEKVARRHELDHNIRPDRVQGGMERFLGSYVLNGATEPFSGNAAALVSVVTRNAIHDAHRRTVTKDGERRFTLVGDMEQFVGSWQAPNNTEDEATAVGTSRIDQLMKAAGCTDEMAQVVKLRFIDGYSQEEIAELLGTPRGTVASRTKRALDRIREYAAITDDTKPWDLFDAFPDKAADS